MGIKRLKAGGRAGKRRENTMKSKGAEWKAKEGRKGTRREQMKRAARHHAIGQSKKIGSFEMRNIQRIVDNMIDGMVVRTGGVAASHRHELEVHDFVIE